MSFSKAPQFEKPERSGISMSIMKSTGGWVVRFTISEKAQEAHFGGSLDREKLDLLVGGGDDMGKAQIVVSPEGEFPVSTSGRGGAYIRVGIWSALPKGRRPAATCEILQVEEDRVTVKLPSWAVPNGAGGKLDKSYVPPSTASKPKG